MKRRTLVAIVAPAFLCGTLVGSPLVSAASKYVQAQLGTSSISDNGKLVAKPPKLVYGGTTYVQLYSIQHSLMDSGIQATWNGKNFSMEIPENAPSQPHLNSVVFTSSESNPYSENNGTNDLSSITYELPAGSATFYTYTDIENISNGTHDMKEVLYDEKGDAEASFAGTFVQSGDGGHSEVIHWAPAQIAVGYNTAKVYLDGKYLGYGEVVGSK